MLTHDTPKDAAINIRVHSGMRDFIDHAAKMAGKDRSDFMLEAACEKAEQLMLDRRFFMLDDNQWEAFNAMLDAPTAPNDKLRELLATAAPWEA